MISNESIRMALKALDQWWERLNNGESDIEIQVVMHLIEQAQVELLGVLNDA